MGNLFRQRSILVLLSLSVCFLMTPLLEARLLPESETRVPFRIMHSGDTRMALEICGCVTDLRGGVAPRGKVIETERAGVDRFLLLDSGGLFSGAETLDRRIAEIYLETLAYMHYDVLLISESEFLFGHEFLFEQIHKWQFLTVATNIQASQEMEVPWNSYVRIEFPRLRIGVIGLIPKTAPGIPAQFAVSDPVEAASRAISDLGDSVDLIVALSTLTQSDEQALLQSVPEIRLVLSSMPGPASQRFYNAYVTRSVYGGQNINVIDGAYLPERAAQPFSFQIRPRDIRPEHGLDEDIRQIVDSFYQLYWEEAQAERPVSRLFADQSPENLPENEYLGSQPCQACHPLEYDHWKDTPHGNAMATLLSKNRHFVPECLVCHTTGFGYPGGFNQVKVDGPLSRVGCESCHGPGALHVQNPANKNWIRRQVPDSLCQVCHDEKNDPNFTREAQMRRSRITHPTVLGIHR